VRGGKLQAKGANSIRKIPGPLPTVLTRKVDIKSPMLRIRGKNKLSI